MAIKPFKRGVTDLKVFSNGKELSGDFQLIQFDCEYAINRIPRGTFVFVDGEPTEQEFHICSKPELTLGKELEIKIGYESKLKSVFSGVIVRATAKVTSEGSCLVVVCKHPCYPLAISEESAVYLDKKDADVIREVLGNHQLKSDIKLDGPKIPQLVKTGCTDWDFIVMRSQVFGASVWGDGKALNVKPLKAEGTEIEVDFGNNVEDANLEVSSEQMSKEVAIRSWNFRTQKEVEKEYKGTDSVTSQMGASGGHKKESTHFKVKQGKIHGGDVIPEELGAFAKSIGVKNNGSFYQGWVKVPGCEDAKIGGKLTLGGFGKSLNGSAAISGVRHAMEERGWFTYIQVGEEATLHAEDFNCSSLPASGLIPAAHGIQFGTVKGISKGPENEFMAQVLIPAIDPNRLLFARLTQPDAGKDRGVNFFPEIEDEVAIGFVNSDPRYPVILGSLFRGKAKPPFEMKDANEKKGIVTREKLQLEFNDKDKEITISTPGKNEIVISDKGKKITLKDQNKNTIELGPSGIKLNTPKKIEMKGKLGVSISSDGPLEMNGMTVKLEAKAKMDIKASAAASINGGAMLEVKGGLVKIN